MLKMMFKKWEGGVECEVRRGWRKAKEGERYSPFYKKFPPH
jgi:hypothetical protein